ncbi:hypothetical protein FGG08_004412 [Glutinoglossum americanum]|uniref:Uncharacterized protein n=1 Tax=Glutinoglossum americanum TaxID=1670608 RepID=A0A9P8I7L3_9PEZI|nr:hypothetical protein FGG08_004412 [Glutinoglossum americanum]
MAFAWLISTFRALPFLHIRRNDSRLDDDSHWRRPKESFAPDVAAAIADEINKYGYQVEGKEMYRVILADAVGVDQELLYCVPDEHRSDLLEYWSSVSSLARRQAASSVVASVAPASSPIASSAAAPATVTVTPQPPAPATSTAPSVAPTTPSTAPKAPTSAATESISIFFPPITLSSLTDSTLLTIQTTIGPIQSASRVGLPSSAPTAGSSRTVATVIQTSGAATTSSTGGPGGLSKGTKIGIAVAVPVAIILLAGIAILLWLNRRYKRKLGLRHPDDGLPVEQGPGVAEAMSNEIQGAKHPSGIPEMAGAGFPHPWLPPQRSELHDTSRVEVAAIPTPPRGDIFLTTGTPELPAGAPTRNFGAQNPSNNTFKEAITSSRWLSRKPVGSARHADPTRFHAGGSSVPGPLNERERQIRELEEQRQKLDAEQQALQERLSRLHA